MKSITLITLYLVSRALLLLSGIHIEGVRGYIIQAPANIEFMHIPDLALLQSRFTETLFYWHAQPPLYAAFIGLGAQSGALWAWMTLLALATGLVLTCSMHQSFLLLKVSRRVAFAATAFFIISPPVLLWEWYTLYTSLVAALLMFGTYLALRLNRVRT